ncbi:hypothetical protein Taro_017287 [Colocasia esculenta]|uniref:Retrotransposon gag domain-containing protein n=1 Tax=Colocasia esculenta TaxID=4460 RepID=A0A843UMR0_COLES|nr:hypothetical protein [Colocasia esculenta]
MDFGGERKEEEEESRFRICQFSSRRVVEELLELLLGSCCRAYATAPTSALVCHCSCLIGVGIAGTSSTVGRNSSPAGLAVDRSLVAVDRYTQSSKPELCLLLAVDSPFLAVDRMDTNAQERLVAAMKMLRQDIELYAQAQREAHLEIKEEVLNLTASAFMAGNPCASLEIMSQVMINLDNLKLGQDLLFHQVEGHWEALTDAARELYHGAGVEQQIPFDLIMDGGDANLRKMESSMHDLTCVMKVVARNNSHNGTSLFKDFRSLDPPRFAGSTDSDEAENWLKDIERIFKMIKCTEEEKVHLTTFQLDRDARAWWETVEATMEDSNQVSWEEFVELFNEQYFSEVFQKKKANEFAGLKQLRMSVFEYEAQFTRLSKYAPHLMSTEKLKAKRFMNGLRPNFITQLTPHLITTYSEMVKRTLALEAANETVDKIRGKSGEGSSDRKRKYESGNAPKIQQAAKKAGKAPVGKGLWRSSLNCCWGAVVVHLQLHPPLLLCATVAA